MAGVTVSTTISEVNKSRMLALSLACAVRGLGVVAVPIVTHRLEGSSHRAQKLSQVKSNAEGKATTMIIMMIMIII